MDLKRCPNGHFYDGDSFTSCPHCVGVASSSPCTAGAVDVGVVFDDIRTEKFDSPTNEDNSSSGQNANTVSLTDLVKNNKEDAVTESDDDQKKTISYYKEAVGSDPIVGWLVCVEGNHFGEDFKLRAGKNFIGRASNMDVCLSGDTSVSRERHAAVLYDPNSNIFLVQSGDSKELTYHNEELVLSAVELHPYDLLKIGVTKLMFVPFCSDKFTWKMVKKDESEAK